MKYVFSASGLALVASLLSVGPEPAHAAGWRCIEDGEFPECEDGLLNAIEDLIDEEWQALTLSMPPMPLTCVKKPGTGRELAPDGSEITPQFTEQLNWSVTLPGDLRSFLLGRSTAAADLFGSIRTSGSRFVTTTWTGQTINYGFMEGTTDVRSLQGEPLGVAELGAVNHTTTAGAFWTDSIPIHVELVDGEWTCTAGPSGRRVTGTGRGEAGGVDLDYPVEWARDNVLHLMAEAVREQFRAAVRMAVMGPPEDCSSCHASSNAFSTERSPALDAVALATAPDVSHAADTCATFFWTNSRRAFVERYQPRYLIGQGLEDVRMGDIPGSRIRNKWSQQASFCIASANRYGYFSHPDFDRMPCRSTEACFPGTRRKKMSERLEDVRNVAIQLSRSDSNPVYQESLRRAKTESYVVIDVMESAKTAAANFYGGLVNDYDSLIDDLTLVLDLALPPSVRTAVFDELCSPENVAELEGREPACIDNGEYCELWSLFNAIQNCSEYQDGATLAELLDDIAETTDHLEGERDRHVVEVEAIQSLWAEIQDRR